VHFARAAALGDDLRLRREDAAARDRA